MPIITRDEVKIYLAIDPLDLTYDARIDMLIPAVEQTYLNIQNRPFKLDDLGDTLYPLGSDVVAAEMVGYKLAKTLKAFGKEYGTGIASMSLDAYSVSYIQGDAAVAYPKSMTNSIKSYINGA